MMNVDREYETLSEKLRKEHIGAIKNNKFEYEKMLKEVEKLELDLKKEKLLDKSIQPDNDDENEKLGKFSKKIDKQNKQLGKAARIGKEITTNQDMTLVELKRQRDKLEKTNNIVNEVENTLSLHDQLVGVMNNRELFNKLKLVGIVVLLFIADILVLYIKLR
jgi:hypothetical protein